MSSTIDSRVVEMRFDNDQFESGVKESLNTLDKLKESLDLDDAAKSFDALDKAADNVDLSGIAAGIEALQNRFSTLGIVGMTVISNITTSLMNMASSAISYVSDSIISGGLKRAQNIENAHFQLQALLKDETAVQAVMDNAMDSVSDTAYAYDEAAKAAAQFAASGLQAGDDMETALRGIVGVASMTNSEYESISRIFTTVAGNGRLMGDQLLQLSSRGLNAASTIADYYREVQGQSDMTEASVREMVSAGKVSFEDFAAAMNWAFGDQAFRANETFNGVMSNIKAAFAKIGAGFFSPLIEQNSDLILMLNSLKSRINDVKSAVVFDEQASAISGLSKVTSMGTDALTELFNTIDENGSVSSDNLKELSSKGIDSIGTLTDYINGVTNGTIRATYATKTAISEMTGDAEVSTAQITQFVEDGKISLDIFTSAMENAYGDQKTLTKQFTDTVLDAAKSISEWLTNLDMSKPIAVFLDGVEVAKNLFKGLYSVLKPVGEAFADVFLSFKGDDVVKFADKIVELTSKLKLSEESSKNLHDAFEGIFNVVKLVVSGFADLFGISLSVGKPMGSLLDLVLSLAGAFGRGLTKITEWINSSTTLKTIYIDISAGIQTAMSSLSEFIDLVKDGIKYVYNLPIVQEFISTAIETFNNLCSDASNWILGLIDDIKDFADNAKEMIPEDARKAIDTFVDNIRGVKDNMDEIDFAPVTSMFDNFTKAVQGLIDVLKGNEGLNTFLSNMKIWIDNITDAFTFDALVNNIESFKTTVTGFINWFKETISPLFEDISVGGIVATAGGVSIIYTVIKAIKSFEKLGSDLQAIPNLLGSVKNTLVAYQKDLKADTILKIAEAIGILTVSLVLLSFADLKKVAAGAAILSGVALVLTGAMIAFNKLTTKGATIETALNNLVTGLTKSLNNLTKAVKWKAIASAIKNMAIAIGVIVASIVVLAVAYSKDSENMNKAVTLIAEIAAVMIGLMAVMSLLGDKLTVGMMAFSQSAKGILELSAAMIIVIFALKQLFGLEIPSDANDRLLLLGKVMSGVTILAIAASRLGGQNFKAAPILAISAALYLTIFSVKKLFELEIPNDYEKRLDILAGIFVGLVAIIVALGLASAVSKNGLKATGTILAMCVMIVTIVAALAVLSIFPAEKLLAGAASLGIVIIVLALALAGAGQIIDKEAWKTVLAMALEIGVIVAALGVLSMISGDRLLKAAVALGSILAVLAADFYTVSKSTKKTSFVDILAMTVAVAAITASLYFLAEQPWESLLAAAVSLGAVLLAFAEAYQMALKPNWSKNAPKKIAVFLEMTLALVPIAAALYILSEKPWAGMLAAAVSMSAVLLAFAESFQMVLKPNWSNNSVKKIGIFLLMTTALIPIATSLYFLAEQPWEGLLAGAVALSGVLLALVAAFTIMEKTDFELESAYGMILGALAAGVIAAALYFLAEQPWEGLLAGAVAISSVLLAVVAALDIMKGVKFDVKSTINLLVGLVAIYLIAFALSGLAEYPWENLLAAAASISVLLISLAATMDLCTTAGAAAPEAVAGIALLDLFIVDLIALIAAIGLAFEKINGLEDVFNKGGEILAKIGTFIGEFVGNIVASAVSAVSATLPQIGQDLSDFATNAQGFFDLMSSVDSKVLEGTKNVVATILLMTAAELINGVASFLLGGVDFSNFADDLKALGKGVAAFAEATRGVDGAAVEAAANSAKALAGIYDYLPREGGWMQKILGEKESLADFATELIPFGVAMVVYSKTVAGKINQEAIEASINAAEVLLGFANELPDMGGLAGLIFGDQKTLSEFATELVPFGKAMANYSKIVSGKIDAEAITASANAAKALSELANNLPTSGGFFSLFTGDQDLSDFGDSLVDFGEGLSNYYDSISGINFVTLALAVAQVNKLIDIANATASLDTSGMTGFASTLETMGNNGIDAFVNAFNDSVSRVTEAVKTMLNAATNAIENKDATFKERGTSSANNWLLGIEGKYAEATTIGTTLATKVLTSLLNKLSEFTTRGTTSVTNYLTPFKNKYSEASVIGITLVSKILSSLLSKATEFTTRGTTSVTNYIQAFKNKYSEASTVGTTLAGKVTAAILSKVSLFLAYGQNSGNNYVRGINQYSSEAGNAGRTLSGNAIRACQSYADAFRSAGVNAGQGFINGVYSKVGDAGEAGAALGYAAYNAARKALNEHSPSKKMAEVGDYAGLGFINSLMTYVAKAALAGKEIGESTLDGASSAFNKVSEVLNLDDISDPVIKPIVDLENVEKSVDSISKMFSDTMSVVSGNIQAASGSMTVRTSGTVESSSQNGKDETSGNTYQFIQNNNSPKSLSRVEIYRQTKNQFTKFKQEVGI
jgi:hypothetical protein